MVLTLVSYDGHNINDTTNYIAKLMGESSGGVADVAASYVERPHFPPLFAFKRQKERILTIGIKLNGTILTQRETIKQWFDPAVDSGEKQLIASDGVNQWYVNCTPIGHPKMTSNLFIINLACGDPVWQRVTATTNTRNQTATGQTWSITPGGNQNAYPVYKIKPTSAKAGGFLYQRFCPVRNQTSFSATSYPYDICDGIFNTSTLITAKMQASGNDLRVYVDGVEVNRWLNGINTTTTKVWINLSLSPKQEATLGTAIASSGAISTIVASTDISGYPSSGMLFINSEMFTYTGKTNSIKTFTGVTRATKGTAEAAHTTSDTVYWIEHEIYIKYGNSTLAAPTTDNTYKPMFLLTSTNTSWIYADFDNAADAHRTGRWVKYGTFPSQYTADHAGTADPASEMGLAGVFSTTAYTMGWKLDHPFGITQWNFANGEKYRFSTWFASATLRSLNAAETGEDTQYTIASPGSGSTWTAWSSSGTISGYNSRSFRFYAVNASITSAPDVQYVEVADVTMTLASGVVPITSIGAEAGAYDLSATLTNTLTNESVTLSFTMSINQELEIDTANKTVKYLQDNSSQMNAITFSSVRYEWLSLSPGVSNTLQLDETGLIAVTITTTFRDRNN